jgi:hypothetical protein
MLASSKRKLFAIVLLCGFLIPCAYGELITLRYGNGDWYIGEVFKGLPHGRGILTSPRGKRYIGEWKDGKYDGQGAWIQFDIRPTTLKRAGRHRKYVGSFQDGKTHGHGTLTLPDGSTHAGEWREGLLWHGKVFDADGHPTMRVLNGVISPKKEPENSTIR